jgi:hypothetical protein
MQLLKIIHDVFLLFNRPGMIVGLCNPLLDISAVTEESFLEKYELLPNNGKLYNLYTEVYFYDVFIICDSYSCGRKTQTTV